MESLNFEFSFIRHFAVPVTGSDQNSTVIRKLFFVGELIASPYFFLSPVTASRIAFFINGLKSMPMFFKGENITRLVDQRVCIEFPGLDLWQRRVQIAVVVYVSLKLVYYFVYCRRQTDAL